MFQWIANLFRKHDCSHHGLHRVSHTAHENHWHCYECGRNWFKPRGVYPDVNNGRVEWHSKESATSIPA